MVCLEGVPQLLLCGCVYPISWLILHFYVCRVDLVFIWLFGYGFHLCLWLWLHVVHCFRGLSFMCCVGCCFLCWLVIVDLVFVPLFVFRCCQERLGFACRLYVGKFLFSRSRVVQYWV